MKYIAKTKGANRFKTYDSITAFDVKDFDTYELYEVKQLNKEQYGEALRQQKISELKGQLEELGVDLNSLVQPQTSTEVVPVATTPTVTSESPLLEADRINSSVKNSKVKKQDGSFFSMEEITESYYKIKDELEKNVPEIMFGSFDENGITLMMTEIRKDLMRRLPNGIPVKQVLG